MSDYKVTDSELTGIANAIRTKGGTSSQLVFPDGFTSAIGAIPTGGADINTDFVLGVPQIPDMTNATTPSGVVSASSYFTSNYDPYMAFNFNIQIVG